MSDEKKFINGNEAITFGALAAGCRCYFGYPITPQNDIPEILSAELPRLGGSFVQAESEVASVNMLLGAAGAGIRAFTSSSSPGISLMSETLSYMASCELPGVIVNINRGGPGLGDIGPSQGDYFQAVKGGGHGDYHLIVLAPATSQECYDMGIEAFDLAFKWRNPVLILGDAIVAQTKEPVVAWTPQAAPEDEAADWCLQGAKGRAPRLLKTLFLAPGELAGQNRKLQAKYASMASFARAEQVMTDDAELIVVAYGSIGRICKSAVRNLRAEGHKVGLVRPQTLFPFPDALLEGLAAQGKRFLTIEQNCGQMVQDVRLAIRRHADSGFFGYMPGDLPNVEAFMPAILDALNNAAG
jgi:2-oxoglutarate ferredoxin oxidoreductase subunit alpha